jgi:hypothetical protein
MKTPMHQRDYYRKLRADGYGVSDAVLTVRRHDYFRKTLSATVKQINKRAKAAKKGWKTRRANARMI